MRPNFRVALLIAALAFLLPLAALPNTSVEAQPAGRQITITITEAQFNKYLPTVKPRSARSIAADIIEGGIIVKVQTIWPDLPTYHEHYGVLIRDGKVVTEAGVIDFPGIGAMGYSDIKRFIPSVIPTLDHNARVMNRFVLSRISAKAGSRYKVESVTTTNDQVVIVVRK